jgi:hypothetical protein
MAYFPNLFIRDIDVRLRQLLNVIRSLSVIDTQDRQRVVVDIASNLVQYGGQTPVFSTGAATAAVPRVAVCSDSSMALVTNVSQFGGIDVRWQYVDIARNAYANGIRQNLIFS